MFEELKELAIALGEAIHASRCDAVRNGADNQRWKDELKRRTLGGMQRLLDAKVGAGIGIRLIETPYNTKVAGRGLGRNELAWHRWRAGSGRHLTLLADVLDGSWNAACGVPWSASTMIALTAVEPCETRAEDLTLADFKCALIVPLATGASGERGFYYGATGEAPRYRVARTGEEFVLHPTGIEEAGKTRVFLDLFTEESYETLAVSIDAVKPLIYEWGDIGRFYGAGIELMSLLSVAGTTPGFGGYVAANQKADNLIPTKMLLEGAGIVVSDWWGSAIDSMRIMDRRYVAIAANRALHLQMLRHLSKTVRLPVAVSAAAAR